MSTLLGEFKVDCVDLAAPTFHDADSLPSATNDTMMLLLSDDDFRGDDPAEFNGTELIVCCEFSFVDWAVVVDNATGAITRSPEQPGAVEFFDRIMLLGRIVTELVSGMAQNGFFEFNWRNVVVDGLRSFGSTKTNLI